MKTHALALLKKADHLEKIVGARIAGGSKRAHQAFRRDMRGRGKLGSQLWR